MSLGKERVWKRPRSMRGSLSKCFVTFEEVTEVGRDPVRKRQMLRGYTRGLERV